MNSTYTLVLNDLGHLKSCHGIKMITFHFIIHAWELLAEKKQIILSRMRRYFLKLPILINFLFPFLAYLDRYFPKLFEFYPESWIRDLASFCCQNKSALTLDVSLKYLASHCSSNVCNFWICKFTINFHHNM